MFKTSPENAPVIEKLTSMLCEQPIDELLTYASMESATGRDVQKKYRRLLDTAKEDAETRLGCIFECVKGVGIKRLASDECPTVGLAAIRRVRKTSKRGKKRLERLRVNSMSEAAKKQTIMYGATLGTIAMMADGKKAMSAAETIDPVKPIPPENILEMFTQK